MHLILPEPIAAICDSVVVFSTVLTIGLCVCVCVCVCVRVLVFACVCGCGYDLLIQSWFSDVG